MENLLDKLGYVEPAADYMLFILPESGKITWCVILADKTIAVKDTILIEKTLDKYDAARFFFDYLMILLETYDVKYLVAADNNKHQPIITAVALINLLTNIDTIIYNIGNLKLMAGILEFKGDDFNKYSEAAYHLIRTA